MRERKLDQFLSVIVILLYALIIAVKWILVYNQEIVPDGLKNSIEIIRTVIQCLMIFVVLYNACGFTGNWLLRIVFVVVALFLIVSTILPYVPAIGAKFEEWNIPTIL